MAVLDKLEPNGVFRFFEELCAIPHGSGSTRAISDYLAAFAAERGLFYRQDGLDNVIIIKDASPGYESAGSVILQGHMDMVCEKAPDCARDMAREGLELAIEGDTVLARGTTLGGDDGIALAMALALLDSSDIPHPRLEAVFTSDEETGMGGALGLDASALQGRRMINIDSEAEGVFTVSCAGGVMALCSLPVCRAPFEGTRLRITVEGLTGGHSGSEIHKDRANADMLLGRLLYAVKNAAETRLLSLGGGLKDNAIPPAASALIATTDAPRAIEAVRELAEILKNEYRATDSGLAIRCESADAVGNAMDDVSTERVIRFLMCAPNGVFSMSAEVEGLVQTSLNLGVLSSDESAVTASFCVRSSVESQKRLLTDKLRCLTEALGGKVILSGDYPGWEYRPDSPLRELMSEVFTEQYGAPPRIEALHAGLECGLFCGKLPGLDCVSIGPDLTDIHTPRERMHIASVQRTWALLLETLKRMK